jgi:hypothetical protein
LNGGKREKFHGKVGIFTNRLVNEFKTVEKTPRLSELILQKSRCRTVMNPRQSNPRQSNPRQSNPRHWKPMFAFYDGPSALQRGQLNQRFVRFYSPTDAKHQDVDLETIADLGHIKNGVIH